MSHRLHNNTMAVCGGTYVIGAGVLPHTYCMDCGRCDMVGCVAYDPICRVVAYSGGSVSNHAAAWTPDDAKPDDPFTAQEDEVAKLGEWPRSKQLQAARYLYNLGIRQTDCDPVSIKRAWKKETEGGKVNG